MLSGLLFITSGLGSDGAPALVQLRTPPPAMMGLPNLPVSLTGYAYTIMKLGPLTFTRKGLSVASTVACLTFTVSCFLHFCLFFSFYLCFWTLGRTISCKLPKNNRNFMITTSENLVCISLEGISKCKSLPHCYIP